MSTNKGDFNRSSLLEGRLPIVLIALVIVISVLPFLLNLFGISFDSREIAVAPTALLNDSSVSMVEQSYGLLRGAFVHSLLEWTAFIVALNLAILAFTHFSITRDLTTPIIGVAFFMAGCMDAFHTLAPDRLIQAVADNQDLIPFTWAICRMFNALIMIVGAGLLLLRREQSRNKSNIVFVLMTSAIFGVIAYTLSHVSATSAELPNTIFPQNILTRPYDAVPLVLFLVLGIWVFPKLYKRFPSLFTQALIVSAIPQVLAQLSMTFGSTALFDNYFNIAHFLKVIAYFVPLMGLVLEYIQVYRNSQLMQFKLTKSAEALFASEQRLLMIVKNIVDGIIVIDEWGTIQEVNPAVVYIFGHTEEEMLGKNVKMLVPEFFQSQHDGYLKRYSETSKDRIIGIRREVTGIRKNKTPFPMDLSVGKTTIANELVFTGVIRDITARKEAEKTKSEFISTVSHELRTPLTSIRGALGLVMGGALGDLPNKAMEMLMVANRNSERLIRLINDLLDLDKLKSGSIVLEHKDVDLIDLANSSIRLNEQYAEDQNIKFKFQTSLNVAKVLADDLRLSQVMNNLISNAIKFSPLGGEIEITVENSRKGWLRTSVRDHGEGISEGFRQQIFKRFAQADSSDEREKGGTGLGLNISKVIIDAHDGHIDFFTAAGGGTVFFFDLAQKEITDDKFLLRSGHEGALVLICEDNEDVAKVIAGMLRKEGLVSDIVSTASGARTLLEENSYMALLLDLDLPDVDGLDLIRELKSDANMEGLPIVVVSATATAGRAEFSGHSTEVVDWIQKPIDSTRLKNSLDLVLRNEISANVLHVEDDLDLVQVSKNMIQELANYQHTSSLKGARELLANNDYDLLIIDVKLPDGSGLELITEIKESCPVVVFTGNEVDRKVENEVAAYLTKGTTSDDQLMTTIRRVIGRSVREKKINRK